MTIEILKKCRSCGLTRKADFHGKCDNCDKELDWWLPSESDGQEGDWLIDQLEALLKRRQYTQILDILKPVEALIDESDHLIRFLSKARNLLIESLLTQAFAAHANGAWEKLTPLCNQILELAPENIEARELLKKSRDLHADSLLMRARERDKKSSLDEISALCDEASALCDEAENVCPPEYFDVFDQVRANIRSVEQQVALQKIKSTNLCPDLSDACDTLRANIRSVEQQVALQKIKSNIARQDWAKALQLCETLLKKHPGIHEAEVLRVNALLHIGLISPPPPAPEIPPLSKTRKTIKLRPASYTPPSPDADPGLKTIKLVRPHRTSYATPSPDAGSPFDASLPSYAAAHRSLPVKKKRLRVLRIAIIFVGIVLFSAFAYTARRNAQFKKAISNFETAVAAQDYDGAMNIAPAIAKKHKHAQELLDYDKARQAFYDKYNSVDTEHIQQFDSEKWKFIINKKAAGDLYRTGMYSLGKPAFEEAAAKLAELTGAFQAFTNAIALDITELIKNNASDKLSYVLERKAPTRLPDWKRGAELSMPQAQQALGWFYLYGPTNSQDIAQGVNLISVAAESGYAVSQNSLGVLFERGYGVTTNITLALNWYHKAADQGYADAQNHLGHLYYYGDGVTKDSAKAAEWYRKAADQGIAVAQFQLGVCYENGYGIPRDSKKAAEWYRKAADQGIAIAQHNLGVCYAHGTGVTKDFEKAVEWYRKAADQGYAASQCNLGFCYANGNGVAKDSGKAVDLFRKAADQGIAVAQHSLGVHYYSGDGVTKNLTKAAEWFREAADQGYADSQYNLGFCYANGTGVTKDSGKAVEWFRKAADQGNAAAQNSLGFCYINGNGVAKNSKKAVDLFREAADQGYADAQCNLGACYYNGDGVEKDSRKAAQWFRKAADQGHAGAKNFFEMNPLWSVVDF